MSKRKVRLIIKMIEQVTELTSGLSTYVGNPNTTSSPVEKDHFCKLILYLEIANSRSVQTTRLPLISKHSITVCYFRVRIWDVIILVPNLLFLLFLAVRFNRARLKLRATSSPIFLTFYGLVIGNVVISVIRCVVSMTVNAAAPIGGNVDKVLWVTVRFFLLSTEMSVVIFGLACGKYFSYLFDLEFCRIIRITKK